MRNWEKILRFPSLGEINTVNNASTCKSPYLCARLKTDMEKGFSQYSVVKAQLDIRKKGFDDPKHWATFIMLDAYNK